MCKVALFIYTLILFRKLRKKKVTWSMMWLNWSVAIINAMLQLLNIYRYRYRFVIEYFIFIQNSLC